MAEQRAFSCWLFPRQFSHWKQYVKAGESSRTKSGCLQREVGGSFTSGQQKRPQKVSVKGTVWWGDILYVNQAQNIPWTFFFPGEMRLKWFYGAGGIMKKGNGFCINCRADYLPFGIILSIRKLKNVGQSSFTIPPSLPSASFGLKWGAEVGLWLALPPASPYDAGLNASCKTHTRKSWNNSTLLLQKKKIA